MNVAMMQPAFMPWFGYYELISRADMFIFLDDFQFSVQSYHQRNRLFVNKGQVGWYTVPVDKKEFFKAPINKVRINDKIPWRDKMLRRIQCNYSRAPFYKNIYPLIESWLSNRAESLAEQNILLIKHLCKIMGFNPEFQMSSQYPSELKRSDRVLELLQWSCAAKYICAQGSFSYMCDDGVFPNTGPVIEFQNHIPIEYAQVGSDGKFEPHLSIIDALMNVGVEDTAKLITGGTKTWLGWSETQNLKMSLTTNSSNCGDGDML